MPVEFNEPTLARPITAEPRISFISKMVIRTGLAKDARGVQRVLIVVLVLVVLATIAVNGAGMKVPVSETAPATESLAP